MDDYVVQVCTLDGQYRRTLIAGDMESPRAIAVDPIAGYLFWTDWSGGSARIERATLAGEKRVVIARVAGGSGWPNGITLDPLSRQIYWIDARSDTIQRASYNGGSVVEVVARGTGDAHGFALAMFGAQLYWTDWRARAVLTAPLRPAGKRPVVLQRARDQPFDLEIIHPSLQPNLTSACRSAGCSHLCLTAGPDTVACTCPHRMKLASDNRTCEAYEQVLLLGSRGRVRALSWDAPHTPLAPSLALAPDCAPLHLTTATMRHAYLWTDHKVLLLGSRGRVRALSWDAPHTPLAPSLALAPDCAPLHLTTATMRHAYLWTDHKTNDIHYVDITTGSMRILIEGGNSLGDWNMYRERERDGDATGPGWTRTLAVDWIAGLIYYTEEDGSVSVADLEGARATPLPLILDEPTSLCVHPVRGRIYFAHADGVEEADGSGQSRHMLSEGADSDHLALDTAADRLCWIRARHIHCLDLKQQHEAAVEVPVLEDTRPEALEMYGGLIIWYDGISATLRTCSYPRCTDAETLYKDSDALSSVRVYDPATQRDVSGACALRSTPCEHLCVPVSETESRCLCARGYRLDGDRCAVIDDVVVYSLSWELRGILTSGVQQGSLLPPLPDLSMASACAYHADGEWLYWSDGESGSVWRVRRDGSERTVLYEPDEPDYEPGDRLAGMAVDWVGGNILWADAAGALVAARLDGSRRMLLTDQLPAPVGSVRVDSIRGWVFACAGGAPWRVRLDGTGARALTGVGGGCGSIAASVSERRVYWTRSRRVYRSRYDGTGVQPVTATSAPAALAAADRLYWLDTLLHKGSILVAPFSNLSDVTVLATNLGTSLKDIMVWAKREQRVPTANETVAMSRTEQDEEADPPSLWSACLGGGGCEGLCLWRRCVCPHGALGPDQRSCRPYNTFVVYSRVNSIDSVRVEDVRPLNPPYPPIQDKERMRNAIAVAYWPVAHSVLYSDIQRGTISAVPLDGGVHRTLLRTRSTLTVSEKRVEIRTFEYELGI
ncbi:hypothetical protein ACJJTC_015935 [Scirpophaga incertulas]